MKRVALLTVFAAVTASVFGRPPNYDESKVAPYTLEDPLTFVDGRKVVTPADWQLRRVEIVRIFEREMFGRTPPAPAAVVTELFEEGTTLAGLGIRRQYRMWFTADKSGPHVDWILFLPNRIAGLKPTFVNGRPVCENTEKCPVVFFLNYRGNHELTTDPEVRPPDPVWLRNDASAGVVNHRPSAAGCGVARRTSGASPFPLETILARGYAVLSACYGQISPDVEVRRGDSEDLAYTGVFSLWPPRDPARDDNITAIGAWAWTLSRGLDLAERIPEIDAKKNVATGCSRLAKTPLLACSRDERFAVCVPVQTGGGGVPLAKRDFGENVSTEVTSFPHWYCKAYAKYADNEQSLKFDQHLLVASLAPRRVLVLGFNSGWFDTKGEYLSCKAASSAWTLHGLPGLPDCPFPANFDSSCIGSHLGYARRGGEHGIAGDDWRWMLDFADQAFGRGRKAVCD